MSDKECLVPESIHKKGKPASQIIYWNVNETVKHQQYVFETLWNKAISAQQKINQIEKGELPEVIEIIRNRTEIQRVAQDLVKSAEKEILVILSSANAFIRNINAGSGQLIVEAGKYHNVSVTILTPMDENVETIAEDLEQSTNIKIRKIEPSSRSTISVIIVDRRILSSCRAKR